jgi:hypothetical protein
MYYDTFRLSVLFGLLLSGLVQAQPVVTNHDADSSVTSASSAEQITVYAYHHFSPYINLEQNRGLHLDFVNELNNSVELEAEFVYQQVSRRELNEMMAAGEPAMVIWTNPKWFKGMQIPINWSTPIFSTRAVMIALKERALKYDRIEDLYGLTLGGRVGFPYVDIDEFVDADLLQRIDAESAEESIEQLLSGEADFVIMSQTRILELARRNGLLSQLEMIGEPRDIYAQHVILTNHFLDQLPAINQVIEKLLHSSEWQDKLNFYGLMPYNIDAD